MKGNISVLVNKFAIPAILLVLGFFMLIVGLKNDQGALFMLASVMMLLSGVLSILYSTGKLKGGLTFGIGGITGVAALVTLFLSFRSCEETQIHDENYAFCKSLAIQNLMDVREVQKIYKEQNGKYASTWSEFESFLNNGTVIYVKSTGTVPARSVTPEERDYLAQFGLYKKGQAIDYNMTEKDAYFLAKSPNPATDLRGFERDTQNVSLLRTRFTENRAYKENRDVNGFPNFHVDSLKFIPFTNGKEQWLLETKDSVKFGDAVIPTIKVSGFIPFAEIEGKNDNKEELYFGNLLTNSLAGSWEK